MFLKKVLNQPNLVGTVMIALLIGSGFVYAFAFDGFNVETATGSEVEAWLVQAGGCSQYTTPPEDCVPQFNDYCTFTDTNGNVSTCSKMCVNMKQKKRCRYCKNPK